MTEIKTAPTGGDVASYIGQLVAQVAELEAALAEKTAEADSYFEDLRVCARALAHIDMALHGDDEDEGVCVGCFLELVEAELEEAEPGYAWAIGLVAEEMAAAEEDDLDDDEDDETAEDAPADEERVIH